MSTTDGGTAPIADDAGFDDERTIAQAAVDEAQNHLRRVMADLDNLRKRCARQVVEERVAAQAVGMTYDADAESGTVVAVVRPGYGESDRQLRPAGVVVAGQRG